MEPASEIRFGPFRLDLARREVWRGTERVELEPQPLAVLYYLAERAGQLVTKDDLLATLWAGTYVTKAVIKTCLHEIRKALGEDATAPRYIETVGREGYRFLFPLPTTTSPVSSFLMLLDFVVTSASPP